MPLGPTACCLEPVSGFADTRQLPEYTASYLLAARPAGVLPSASFRFAVTHNTLAALLALPFARCAEDIHLHSVQNSVAKAIQAIHGFRRKKTRRVSPAGLFYKAFA